MKLNFSSIKMSNNTFTVDLIDLMQKIRKEFIILMMMLILQTKEQVTTL